MDDRSYSINRSAKCIARFISGEVEKLATKTIPEATVKFQYNDEMYIAEIRLGTTGFPKGESE